jgi:hypothetical protein
VRSAAERRVRPMADPPVGPSPRTVVIPAAAATPRATVAASR